jgi:hypothetical protein
VLSAFGVPEPAAFLSNGAVGHGRVWTRCIGEVVGIIIDIVIIQLDMLRGFLLFVMDSATQTMNTTHFGTYFPVFGLARPSSFSQEACLPRMEVHQNQ